MEEMAEGGTPPAALLSRPVLHDWMKEYVKGFSILSGTRQCGMGPNPIQLTEILAYLQLYGSEDQDRFIEYILQMDHTFLSAKASREERKQKAVKGTNK